MWDRLQKDNAFYLACVFYAGQMLLRRKVLFGGVSKLLTNKFIRTP